MAFNNICEEIEQWFDTRLKDKMIYSKQIINSIIPKRVITLKYELIMNVPDINNGWEGKVPFSIRIEDQLHQVNILTTLRLTSSIQLSISGLLQEEEPYAIPIVLSSMFERLFNLESLLKTK